MVEEIKRNDKTYFVCDCEEMHLTHIINNKSICSNCKFRLKNDIPINYYKGVVKNDKSI